MFANTRNAELHRDMNTTRKNLTNYPTATQEASNSVYAIQRAVSNMTLQMDDGVWIAVETIRLRVDLIHNQSVPTSISVPAGVPYTGSNDSSTNPGTGTDGPSTGVDGSAAKPKHPTDGGG